jgi:hypothetical protein
MELRKTLQQWQAEKEQESEPKTEDSPKDNSKEYLNDDFEIVALDL